MNFTTADTWKIDELAYQSGVSVDTIRFYSREGLLPAAGRDGRGLSYGPEHLERLRQIRRLQERHFSLAAIRDLCSEGRLSLVERLFDRGTTALSRKELLAQTGLDDPLLARLESMGIVTSTGGPGEQTYDSLDLGAVRSIKSLLDSGMPEGILLLLAGIYVRQMAALRYELLNSFGEPLSDLGPDVSSAAIDAFVTAASTRIDSYLTHFEVLIAYLHRRMLENLTAEAVDVAQALPTGEASGTKAPDLVGSTATGQQKRGIS